MGMFDHIFRNRWYKRGLVDKVYVIYKLRIEVKMNVIGSKKLKIIANGNKKVHEIW
jgi:hypothetical protein